MGMCCKFKLVLAANVISYLFGLAAVVFAGATIRTGRAFGSGVARRLSGWLAAAPVSEPVELTETWGLYGSNTQGNNNGLPADATFLLGCQTTAH
jgi:hypothetical protein